MDACVNFTGLHEAIVTDVSGDKIRVIYEGGQVYETERGRGGTSLMTTVRWIIIGILLDVWDGGGCGSDHDVDIGGVVKEEGNEQTYERNHPCSYIAGYQSLWMG